MTNSPLDEFESPDRVRRLYAQAKVCLMFWGSVFLLFGRSCNLHGTLGVLCEHILELLLVDEATFSVAGLHQRREGFSCFDLGPLDCVIVLCNGVTRERNDRI